MVNTHRQNKRPWSPALSLAAAIGLVVSGCASEPEEDPTPTDTVTETATASAPVDTGEPTENEPTEEEPTDEASATETFTTQGGTFSFEVPEDWTAETTEYVTDNVDYNGAPYEVFRISSPQGDIVISGAVHNGPTSGDGWRSQHWELADVEELTDLPLHDDREHNYLRTAVEWLGEQDEDIDLEGVGWDDGDYRMNISVVSQDEDLEPGETDNDVRLAGWAYWTPLPGTWAGETSFIGVSFDQELIEGLTGETGRDDAVEAFLENEWYQTTREILASMSYDQPDEDELPIDE
ncbi:hypothetical protein [Citricoccus sp. NR2]|uniref:hypothetical protein n=1 Tax=Citricoccus sp. NR2 TaxID=3004095 RepID=UPI0022DE5A6C|nr:hypothetical protein [Citricoccus sp. NR2]WBL18030.1 hypothetical protein O1A05_09470 [Citricoccus sp. NR2]